MLFPPGFVASSFISGINMDGVKRVKGPQMMGVEFMALAFPHHLYSLGIALW